MGACHQGGEHQSAVKAGALAYVRSWHECEMRPCPHLRRLLINAQMGGQFSGTNQKAPRRGVPNELLQTRDHFDDRPQFVRSPIDHLECDVENHSQAGISDPAMILQQASNEARRDAHQPDRQCKTEYQNDRMLPRGTCDSENIVERHRHVSDDDLPGSLGERFAGDMCGNRSVGIDIIACQCLGGLLLLLNRCAELSPHLPAYPEEEKAPGEQKPNEPEKLCGYPCEYNAQCRRDANANEDRLRALLVRQTSRSQANDDGVIARQNQVDHDDLEERCNGVACQQSSHAAGSLLSRTATMARMSALSRPPYPSLAILTRHRTGLRTRLSAHIALPNDGLFY